MEKQLMNIMQISLHIFGRLLVVFFALLFPAFVHAEEISRYEETIHILSNGTIAVTESIGYDFGKEDRHGIFRTIPTMKTNEEGIQYVLDFDNFSVTDPYSQITSDGVVTLKIGDPDKTITGTHTYDIFYRVGGALTYFSDHDELYWNVTGREWEVPIASVIVHIELPANVEKNNLQIACFTGSSGSTETNCLSTFTNKTVTVQSTRPLASYEGLTIVVGFPKGLVAVLEPKEYVPFWHTVWGKILLVCLALIALFWYILLPLSLPFRWWRYGRDPKPAIGEASAWFASPKTKKGRSLAPGETGTLMDEKADNADITATIIDLARRGYLKILEPKKGDIHFEKVHPSPDDALEKFEKLLFDGIFQKGDLVNLKTGSLIKPIQDTKDKLYDAVLEEGFFLKNPQSVRTKYSILGTLALITGNFPLVLSAFTFGMHMPKKTLLGAQTAVMARALKNFITSQDGQFKFQAEKQMLFEKMLPFAIAFGVEKIWAARFAQMHLKQPDWYSGYSGLRFNSIVLADSLSRTSSSISKAATPVSSSTGHSSGFSGGSSGGGGGGGGGGSW